MNGGKTIIVTGASRGIGAGIALELARRGFTVACLSRSGNLPEAVKAGDEALSSRLYAFTCDINDEACIVSTFQEIAKKSRRITGLVNNAGIHLEGRSSNLSAAEFESVLKINTIAPFIAAREAYPHLVEAGGGLIINIGSFFDRLGAKGNLAYAASKAAIVAMTRVLAAEWGKKGNSVLNVAPGYIETDINREYLSDPQIRSQVSSRIFTGRPGQVNEVARLVSALFAEDIKFLTGETICIDGGQSVSL